MDKASKKNGNKAEKEASSEKIPVNTYPATSCQPTFTSPFTQQEQIPGLEPSSQPNQPSSHNTTSENPQTPSKQPISVFSPVPTMADYENQPMPNQGQHFQPPVPDTTWGPYQHHYVPRFDNGTWSYTMTNQPIVQNQQPQAVPVPMFPQAAPPMQQMPQMQPVFLVPAPVGQVAPATMQPVQPIMYQQAAGGIQQPQPVYLQGQAQPGYVAPQPQQPQFIAPQPTGYPGMMGGQQQFVAGAGPSNLPPDIMGIGKTAGEHNAELFNSALNNKMLEPQDFKPADDDVSRMYPVRELDGNWTQRNRYTIDNLGDCRWYVTDTGCFYAVRLPN